MKGYLQFIACFLTFQNWINTFIIHMYIILYNTFDLLSQINNILLYKSNDNDFNFNT